MANFIIEAIVSYFEPRDNDAQIRLKGIAPNFYVKKDKQGYNLFWPGETSPDKPRVFLLLSLTAL